MKPKLVLENLAVEPLDQRKNQSITITTVLTSLKPAARRNTTNSLQHTILIRIHILLYLAVKTMLFLNFLNVLKQNTNHSDKRNTDA